MAGPAPGELGGPGLPGRVRITDATITTKSITEVDRFGQFIKAAERSGDDLMEQLAQKMEDKARRFAPVRTGRLRRSIKVVILNNGREARLYSDTPYAGVMEYGSRPHLIHGVRANFDWRKGRFVWNDSRYGPIGEEFNEAGGQGGREARLRSHFRRGKSGYQNWTYANGATVRHPGTKPHLYMSRAFYETFQEARFVMRRTYPG